MAQVAAPSGRGKPGARRSTRSAGAKRPSCRKGTTSRELHVTAEPGVTMLGIVPSALPPQPLVLRHVECGSWADKCGIVVGDDLVTINGVHTSTMDIRQLDHFLRKERPLHLIFVRRQDVETHTEPAERRELRNASTGIIEDILDVTERKRAVWDFHSSVYSQGEAAAGHSIKSFPWHREAGPDKAVCSIMSNLVFGACFEQKGNPVCKPPSSPGEIRMPEQQPFDAQLSCPLQTDEEWLESRAVGEPSTRELTWTSRPSSLAGSQLDSIVLDSPRTILPTPHTMPPASPQASPHTIPPPSPLTMPPSSPQCTSFRMPSIMENDDGNSVEEPTACGPRMVDGHAASMQLEGAAEDRNEEQESVKEVAATSAKLDAVGGEFSFQLQSPGSITSAPVPKTCLGYKMPATVFGWKKSSLPGRGKTQNGPRCRT
eukprot:CAMPEP_0172814614 /NCGR_PEP_ID=MMETSP1075-20121228/11326_1 /TAXON_ID=2916 /ORGANISM="Ceratium fusus, Strain PA161109" /LENGTH=429 /DNA_ID=CAMNT_0013654419 /DNA_START=51 /DNA_END=1340 /DNA_ORIENTATION=+